MKAIPLLRYFKTKKGTTYKMMCRVNEAIKEIENLENRSCSNCKYWNYQFTHSLYKSCTFGLIEHSYEESSFSCNRWKPEDEVL